MSCPTALSLLNIETIRPTRGAKASCTAVGNSTMRGSKERVANSPQSVDLSAQSVSFLKG